MTLREHWPQCLIVWLLINAIAVTMLYNGRDRATPPPAPSDTSRSETPMLRIVR